MTNGTHNSDWEFLPQASLSDDDFDEDEALDKRRQERLKRKSTDKRKQRDTAPDGDPDVLLEQRKRPKKERKRRQQPDVWDENYDDRETDLWIEDDDE